MTTTLRTCDICSDPHPPYIIPVRTFDMKVAPGFVHRSLGSWVLCGPCTALVDRGDIEGLVRRAADAFHLDTPQREYLIEVLRAEYGKLIALREGPSQVLADFIRDCPHPAYEKAISKTHGEGRFCVRCGERMA